jgi:hypothetical protein
MSFTLSLKPLRASQTGAAYRRLHRRPQAASIRFPARSSAASSFCHNTELGQFNGDPKLNIVNQPAKCRIKPAAVLLFEPPGKTLKTLAGQAADDEAAAYLVQLVDEKGAAAHFARAALGGIFFLL